MRSYDAYDTSIYNKGQRDGEQRGEKKGILKQAIETAKKS